MCTSTVQSSPASAGAALSPHPRLQASCPSSAHYMSSPSAPPPPSLAPDFSSAPPSSTPPWLSRGYSVECWRSSSREHWATSLSFVPSCRLVCIRESGLNSSSSFWFPGFSALRSGRARSRSGVLSSGVTHAGGGVVVFLRRGLSFSELSTSSLSSLDPHSDYVGINISLNNSSLLSFLNVYAPLFALPRRVAGPTPFLPPSFPPLEVSSFLGFQLPSPPMGLRRYLRPPRGGSIRLGHFF